MKGLGYFNLLGVMVLAALCVVQWRINRRINLEEIGLDKVRQQQAQTISDQKNALAGCAADLDQLRTRLEQTDAALKEVEGKLDDVNRQKAQVTAERDQAIAERDQCTANLAKWMAAVKERDAALKKAADEITALSKGRNDAVQEFNDLARKYNGVVKDLNNARTKPSNQ